MGSGPDKIEAPKANYSKDIQKFVSAYGGALPQVLGFERQFRPEFQGLNLQDISSFLGGAGGQEGLFGLSRRASEEASRQLGASREQELGQMTGQTSLARGLMQGLSPEQTQSVQQAQEASQRAYAASQGVTPEQQRMYQQTAREARQASGRLGGNAAIASEIMGREQSMMARRQEAAQAGQRAFEMAQGFYTQPGLQLLGNQPLSYQTGQQMLGMGMGQIGRGTPGLISPDTGLNLGAAERANILQAQIANAQAEASGSAGLMGGLGSAFGGLAQGIGAAGGVKGFLGLAKGAAAGAAMLSDRRLKTDIKKVGKTNAGLPIYTYKYKGSDTTQMGVMAQDVEKKTPNAIKEIGGFKAVNYSFVK
jgi:hypothetical protein